MAVPGRGSRSSGRPSPFRRGGGRPSPFGKGGKSSHAVLGGVLIAVAVAIGAAALWFHGSAKSSVVDLRPDDLCPKDIDRSPPAIYAVLVDQTDPLSPLAQQSIVNTVLKHVRAELEAPEARETLRHALVEIWTFSNAGRNVTTVGDVMVATERVLAMCNPGAPGDWDKLYRNVDVVRRQHARFYKELEDTLRASLSFPEAKQSPVVEAIYAMGVQVFSRPNAVKAQKQLVIVSDLLQNTTNLSMFAGKPRFDTWIATPQAQKALPSLTGVTVRALVIPGARPDLQRTEFAQFWMALFGSAGAIGNPQLVRVN
jgi:hypothetical protein